MKKKASKKVTKPKVTHTIELWRGLNTGHWNWHVKAANGEVICFSNQDHSRAIDARAAVRNFLKAVVAGTVVVP